MRHYAALYSYLSRPVSEYENYAVRQPPKAGTMRLVTRIILTTFVLCLLPTLAVAAPTMDGNRRTNIPFEDREILVEVGPDEADILSPDEVLAARYHILFVNPCRGGETISPGFNDSRTNHSSVPNQTVSFPAYPYDDASWNQVMTHTRSILAPFGIEVTDEDPGDTPHTEIITCGQSFAGSSVLGIAPFGCGLVANAVGFAFAEEHDDERQLAETIVHEAGHTFSLNHLYDCEDPMTYLTDCGDKYFQDATLQCAGVSGEGYWETQSCGCSGTTQNSHQTLLGMFGPDNNNVPTLTLEAPANNATVGPGFSIRGQVTGMNGGESVEIYVDGALELRVSESNIDVNASESISDGAHTVTVIVVDQYERRDEITRNVTVSAACQCADDQYCDGEQCFDFAEVGDSCESDVSCKSALCGSAGDTKLCTSRCTPGSDDQCTGGTSCVDVGDGGLCWPSDGGDDGICGCRTTGTGTATIWAFLFVVFLLRRRRSASVEY